MLQWYNPHITLVVNEDCESKDLGPMMRVASQVNWEKTDNASIFMSEDKTMIKIECTTNMTAVPQVVTTPILSVPETPESDSDDTLLGDMLRQVPEQLWSKHDTDVGLVKAANPVRIDLKPNVQLPNKPQYLLKLEAVKGISID